MKLVVILSLISSFQIYHQTIVNSLTLHYGFSITALSFISASFPAGKFLGTFLIVPLYEKYSMKFCLNINAILIILGAMFSFIPACIFLCFGRFLIGVGVGIGFVASNIAICDSTSYSNRPEAFFISAFLFSLSILFGNVMALVRGLSYFTFILFVNIPVIISGIIYLRNKDLYDEPAKYAISPQRMNQIRSWPAPYNPQNLALLLMGINASIGVPIILAFSALIYEQLHIPIRKAAHLSVFYPFIQLIVILALKWKFCCSLKRRDLVLGGYGISIMAFFLLLITLEYGTLETNPAAKAAASAAWFTVLAVSISIPCNTALCYITEQFPDRKSQIRGTSKARMFLWFLSAISSGTFLPILHATSIFFALLSYFVISIIIFVLLIFAVPEEVEESHESIVMDYGTSILLE